MNDVLDPSANVITVTGMRCVGVLICTPEFVHAYVRAKTAEIGNDVQKLSIIKDPKIHCDLLRFCQHTRLGVLGRTLLHAVMMTSTNGVFSSAVRQALRKAKIQGGRKPLSLFLRVRHKALALFSIHHQSMGRVARHSCNGSFFIRQWCAGVH